MPRWGPAPTFGSRHDRWDPAVSVCSESGVPTAVWGVREGRFGRPDIDRPFRWPWFRQARRIGRLIIDDVTALPGRLTFPYAERKLTTGGTPLRFIVLIAVLLSGCAATPEPADTESTDAESAEAVSAGEATEAESGNVSVKRENEKVVCHHERETGTHFSRRVCRTVSEAEADRAENKTGQYELKVR